VTVQDAMPNIRLKVKLDGINVTGVATISARMGKVADSIPQLGEYETEMVFIVTKACHLKDIIPEIKKIQTQKMKIVSFQNGLDNERLIAEGLGVDTTYRIVINYAGNIVSPGNVIMNWFQPPNYVGALCKGKYVTDQTTKKIADLLTAAGLETQETRDIKKYVWEKTILNSALCSICGVTGQTMKEAMDFEYSRRLAIEILKEGLNVAEADGYSFGKRALTGFTEYLEKGGAHKPSMLIDIENKRPTEIEFLSGAVARYGGIHKVPTPVNSTFADLIRTIENRYLQAG
jgi:2-dehydropantoate 2-reductase